METPGVIAKLRKAYHLPNSMRRNSAGSYYGVDYNHQADMKPYYRVFFSEAVADGFIY
jgi:hypothetical protein